MAVRLLPGPHSIYRCPAVGWSADTGGQPRPRTNRARESWIYFRGQQRMKSIEELLETRRHLKSNFVAQVVLTGETVEPLRNPIRNIPFKDLDTPKRAKQLYESMVFLQARCLRKQQKFKLFCNLPLAHTQLVPTNRSGLHGC